MTDWALVALATVTLSACGGATATGLEPAARGPAPAAGGNASRPGEPVAEPATFHSLGVRWAVLVNGIPWHIEPGGETVKDVVTRNNLFVGTRGPALRSTGAMIRCEFDRDGYGGVGDPGSLFGAFRLFAEWNGRMFPTPEAARRSGALYRRYGAVLVNARGNFARGLGAPGDSGTRFPGEKTDLRLDPASRAVDAGVVLPNFNDGFAGQAPDLGCCELGQPLPHYGPRP